MSGEVLTKYRILSGKAVSNGCLGACRQLLEAAWQFPVLHDCHCCPNPMWVVPFPEDLECWRWVEDMSLQGHKYCAPCVRRR